jgi:hypothetical protein
MAISLAHPYDALPAFIARLKQSLYESSTAAAAASEPEPGLSPSSSTSSSLSTAGLFSFHVSPGQAAWLTEMAACHNCESVNKTLRDVVDFMSLRVPSRLRETILARQSASGVDREPVEELCANFTRAHHAWLLDEAEAHELSPDEVLALVLDFCTYEIDEEELFESRVNFAKSTAELYSDIGHSIRWS